MSALRGPETEGGELLARRKSGMYKAEKRRKEIKRQAKREAKLKRRQQKLDGEITGEDGAAVDAESPATAEPRGEAAAGDGPA